MKKNRVITALLFGFFLIITICSCEDNSYGDNSSSGTYVSNPSSVEIDEIGTAPILDTVIRYPEETSNKELPKPESDPTESEYTKTPSKLYVELLYLVNNPEYIKKNGKCRRKKIADKLNELNVTNPNGGRFKRSDIPKDPDQISIYY